jgi:fatty acid desaturase
MQALFDPNKIQMIDVAFVLMAFIPLAIFIASTLFTAWAWLLLPALLWWELKTFKAYSLNLEERQKYND